MTIMIRLLIIANGSLEMKVLHAQRGSTGKVSASFHNSSLTVNPVYRVNATRGEELEMAGKASLSIEDEEDGEDEEEGSLDDDIPLSECNGIELDSLYSGGNSNGPMDSESGAPTPGRGTFLGVMATLLPLAAVRRKQQ